MPIVDYFLNSLVKYLQKKQKQRLKVAKRLKKKKKKLFKRKKKPVKKKVKKKSVKRVVRKPLSRQKKTGKKIKKKNSVKKKSRSVKSKNKKFKKKRVPVKKETKLPNEACVGEVTHYFSKIKVIVLKMTSGKLCVGDKIHIKGRTTDFSQPVQSLQIESVDVKVAKKGQLVGLRVNKKSKEGDKVFKVGK